MTLWAKFSPRAIVLTPTRRDFRALWNCWDGKWDDKVLELTSPQTSPVSTGWWLLRHIILSDSLPPFISVQSCHIGEEDEGGEQNGEEPSFEVRQTEMVWGGTRGWGHGAGGVGGDRSRPSPTHAANHTRTWHSPPPPHHHRQQHSAHFLPTRASFPAGCGLTCACLCWTRQSDQCHGLNCMTWVQREGAAKDNKMAKTVVCVPCNFFVGKQQNAQCVSLQRGYFKKKRKI